MDLQFLAEFIFLAPALQPPVIWRKSEVTLLLVGRLQQQPHRARERVPFRLFAGQLPSASRSSEVR